MSETLLLGAVAYDPKVVTIWDGFQQFFAERGLPFDYILYTNYERQVMAHFDLPKKMGDTPGDDFLREVALPALDAIMQAGVAIEINTSGRRHDIKDFYPSGLLLQMACERGIPVVFGSDAHRPDDTGRDFADAVAFAKKAGYRERAVFEKRMRRLVPL